MKSVNFHSLLCVPKDADASCLVVVGRSVWSPARNVGQGSPLFHDQKVICGRGLLGGKKGGKENMSKRLFWDNAVQYEGHESGSIEYTDIAD